MTEKQTTGSKITHVDLDAPSEHLKGQGQDPRQAGLSYAEQQAQKLQQEQLNKPWQNRELSNEQIQNIDKSLNYRSTKQSSPDRIPEVREKAKDLAMLVVKHTKPGREQTAMIAHLGEIVEFANDESIYHQN